MKLNKYVVALACTLAAAAHAENNFYVLGSIGTTLTTLNKGDINKLLEGADSTLSVSSSSIDQTDSGYKFQVGYKLMKNFAVEGGYVDLGQAEIKSNTTYTANNVVLGSGQVKTDWKAKGWNIDAVGIIPVNDSISLLAKFGVIETNVEAKAHSSGYVSGSDSTTSNHISSIFGFGAAYAINDSFSIRAEAECYCSLGNADKTGRGDIYLFSAGAAYHF